MTIAATNKQAFFGSGTLILRETNFSNVAPALMGVLQDITLDIDSKQVPLMGQFRMPVDQAAGALTIKGKAKAAQFQILVPNLIFGQTVASGMTDLATGTIGNGESGSIPTTPYQITVVNAATYLADYGVYFASGMQQLTPVASSPATGQYSVNTATGVYTFAAADTGKAVYIYYSFTQTTTGESFSIPNVLMGSTVPQFEMFLRVSNQFQGNTNNLALKLNACKSSKLSLNFANDKWLIPDFEFDVFADSSNNIGVWSSTN